MSFKPSIIMSLLLMSLHSVGLSAAGDYPQEISATVMFDSEAVLIERNERYDRVGYRSGGMDMRRAHEGLPQLPVKVIWLLLPPNTAVATVSHQILDVERIQGRFVPFPVPPYDAPETPPSDVPPWDSSLVFPTEPLISGGSGQYREYRMAKLYVWPLRYRASDGSLQLTKSMEIRVQLRSLSPREAASSLSYRRPETVDGPFGLFRDWIATSAANARDLQSFYPGYETNDRSGTEGIALRDEKRGPLIITDCPSSTGGVSVQYLIITSDVDENGSDLSDPVNGSMSEQFQEYAELLTRYGTVTTVRTIAQIEACIGQPQFDRPALIREFIKRAASEWGTSYVLLGGDEAVLPARRLSGVFNGRPDMPSDRWYTRVGPDWEEWWNTDGDGFIAESTNDLDTGNNGVCLHVHRLPARNAREAKVMVDKTRNYLLLDGTGTESIDSNFYDKALVVAGMTHGIGGTSNKIDLTESRIASRLENADGRAWDIGRLYPRFDGPSVVINGDACLCYKAQHDSVVNYYAPASPDYWETNKFHQSLRSGQHFVWHIEHSFSTKLGDPTIFGPNPITPCGIMSPAQEVACQNGLAADQAPVEDLLASQVLGLDNAAGYPNYSIVMSSGSFTNTYEVDAISEAFLRAPNGGAVVYVGQSKSNTFELLDGYAERFVDNFVNSGAVPLGQAWFQVSEQDPSADNMTSSAITALGDPMLWMWPGPPPAMDVEIHPLPYDPDDDDEIEVQVRKAGTGIPIVGATVCFTQRDSFGNYWRFETRETEDDGVVTFENLNPSDDPIFDTYIGVMKYGWRPHLEEISIEQVNKPLLVYSSHVVDDTGLFGDGDGTLEVGEEVTLEIAVKNIGTGATNASTIMVRPSPPVYMQLAINETYRPLDVLIGKEGVHPEGNSEVFRVPNPTRMARAEGQPSFGGTGEQFVVWRDELTGTYTIAASSQSQSPDTVFTGIVTTPTGFANVTHNAGFQDVVYASADSIYFEFHGSFIQRKIQFDSIASDWCAVSGATDYVSSVAPGDSAVIEISLDALGTMNGTDELLMTVTTTDSYVASPYVNSDFLIRPMAPDIKLAGLKWSWADVGCGDTTLCVNAMISNVGSASADSVVLVLRDVLGSLTPVDTMGVEVDLEAGAVVAMEDVFLLCAEEPADTAGFAATLELNVYKGTRRVVHTFMAAPGDGGGGGGYLSHLRADLLDGAVALTWDSPAPGAVEQYFVGVADDPQGTDIEWLAALENIMARYEVRSIHGDPLTYADGPYYFFVAAHGRGFADDTLSVGPVYPWLKEREGWPVLLSNKSDCAPVAISALGAKVMAGTDVAYMMNSAGASVKGITSAGTARSIFNPVVLDSALTPQGRTPDRAYRAAGTFDELVPNTLWLGADVMLGHGLHLFEMWYAPFPISEWQSGAIRYHAVPVDGPALIPPHEDTYLPQLVFAAGWNDPHIYAYYVANGYPFGATGGMFCEYPGDAEFGAIALGYDDSNDKYEIVATTLNGWVAVYPIPSLLSSQQSARWDVDVNPSASTALCPPVVGDVDGDGDNDIVTGSGSGVLYIIDESSGDILYSGAVGHAMSPGYCSLADLDGDSALEIVACPVGNDSLAVLQVLDYDESEDDWITFEVTGKVPDTQVNGGSIEATGPAVVVDYDFSGSPDYSRPEIIVGTTGDAIFAFEFDRESGSNKLRIKPGWPMLFPDDPLTPALVQFGGSDDRWTMVVQTRDGWLHAVDLPFEGEPGPALWRMYGANSRNTLSILTNDPSDDPQRSSGPSTGNGVTISGVAPQPTSAQQELRLHLATNDKVVVEVFDVTGRRVRSLFDGQLEAGERSILWDGLSENGSRAAAGVYWYRIRWSDGAATRRAVVVR